MNGDARRWAIEKLEAVAELLVAAGFTVERLDTRDEEGEPFRAKLYVRIECSELPGVL